MTEKFNKIIELVSLISRFRLMGGLFKSCSFLGQESYGVSFLSLISTLVSNNMKHPAFSKKMELFTSLHAKVQDHNKVLEERNTALEKMQGKLVKDSVSVLGGVNNQNA